jgi:hypothetical protein
VATARKLSIEDIADTRAYERDRDEFRRQVIETKRRRRVALGTIVTVLFENRQTIRFQIQEMARAERLTTDAAIQEELDTYNPMIPEPGELHATLFIELTSDEQMREWLPKLVGIERSLVLVLPDGRRVANAVDPEHARQLTREDVTAAVHYVTYRLTPDQVAAFGDGVALACSLPAYLESIDLAPETVAELRADLLPDA